MKVDVKVFGGLFDETPTETVTFEGTSDEIDAQVAEWVQALGTVYVEVAVAET